MRRKLLGGNGKNFVELVDNNEAQQQKVERAKPQQLINQLLPEIGYWHRFYYKFSTFVFILKFISVSFLYYSGDLRYLNYDGTNSRSFKFQCYLPRLVLHGIFQLFVTVSAAFAASILHLIWRFTILYLKGEFVLNPILFLLINDDKLIEQSGDIATALKTYRRNDKLELIQSIMLYKIEDKLHNNVEFRVRPNRMPESRATLIKHITFATNLSNFILYPMSFLGMCSMSWTLMFNIQLAYTGCKIESYNFAHLFRFIGSFLICTVTIVDGLVTIMYPILVSYILTLDLLLYWHQIHLKLMDHLKMMYRFRTISGNYHRPEVLDDMPRSRARCCHHESLLNTISSSSLKTDILPAVRLYCRYEISGGCANRTETSLNVEAKSKDLESMVADFFVQLEEADQYVSLTLAWAFCIWLACVSVIFLMDLETGTNIATIILLRNIQLACLAILIIMTVFAITLKRATEPAYGTICSIMAQDPTVDKGRWVLLLNYFTGRHPKHAFTLLRSRIYTLGLFLEIFSYTFTFGLYLQTFGIVDVKRH